MSFINWVQRLESLVSTFQASLHWKAILTTSAFRRPSPPLCFDVQILYHAISRNPFSALDFCQKKSRRSLSIWCVVDLGSWKHYMVCAGRDSKWDWIKTARPALERELAFHPASLEVALLIISWKVMRKGCSWNTGHPRYLPSESLLRMLRIPIVECFCGGVTFFENVIADLWRLSNWPDRLQNLSRVFLTRVQVRGYRCEDELYKRAGNHQRT